MANTSGSAHPEDTTEDTSHFIPLLISPVCSIPRYISGCTHCPAGKLSFVPRKLLSASLWLIGIPSCSHWFSYTQMNTHPCILGTESLTHSYITIQQARARALLLSTVPYPALFFSFFLFWDRVSFIQPRLELANSFASVSWVAGIIGLCYEAWLNL